MKAEELLKLKLKDKIVGNDIILEKRDDLILEKEILADGTVVEKLSKRGEIRIGVSVEDFANLFRDILEDDVTFPSPKIPYMKAKKFFDVTGKEIDPGYFKYLDEWEKEGIDL